MTGAELRAHRQSAGLSQARLANLAGVGRQAVSYWEGKAHVPARQRAPKRLFAALCLTVLPDNRHRYARAGMGS